METGVSLEHLHHRKGRKRIQLFRLIGGKFVNESNIFVQKSFQIPTVCIESELGDVLDLNEKPFITDKFNNCEGAEIYTEFYKSVRVTGITIRLKGRIQYN